MGDHDHASHHPPAVPPAGAGQGLFGTAPARRLRSLLGINEEILRHAWTDARYYTIVSALAVQIAILAAVSMSLALAFMLGPGSAPRAVLAGVAWGTLILSLDLLMLVPEPAKPDGRRGSRHAKMLLRVVLAGLLGILIAEPFVATLLRRDVDHTATEAAKTETKEVAAAFSTDTVTEERRYRDELQEQIDAAEADVTAAVEAEDEAIALEGQQLLLCNAEIVDGSGGQRGRGRGPVAEELCRPLEGPEGLTAKKEAATAARRTAEQDRDTAITGVETSVDEHMETWTTANTPEDVVHDPDSLGVWQRIRATNELMGRWHWLVAGVLIVLDSLPVIYKWFKGVTTYERRLQEAEEDCAHSFAQEVESFREQRQRRREAMAPLVADGIQRHAKHGAVIDDARRKLAFRLEMEQIKAQAAAAGAPTDWVRTIDVDRIVDDGSGPVVMDTRRAGEVVKVGGYRYTLIEKVGAGGFAEVWRVQAPPDGPIQERHADIVAKLAHVDDEDAMLALSQEATQYDRFGKGPSASRYPQVFRAADDGIILEFYPRLSLDRWVFDTAAGPRPITYEMLFQMYDQLAMGLSAIWDYGLIHGDGKAQNVLVAGLDATEDRAEDPVRLLIADLGSMVPVNSTARFATPFCSPLEIFRGEPVDPCTDIFSFFGCISYSLLSGGQTAWWDLAGEGVADPLDREHMMALMAHPPRLLEEYNPTIPPELARQVELWLDPVRQRRVGGAADQLLTVGQIREQLRCQIEDLGPVLANKQIIRGNAASGPTTEPPPERS